MTEPAHVSVSLTAFDGKGLAKLHLTILYGERAEKEAFLQMSVSLVLNPDTRGDRSDVFFNHLCEAKVLQELLGFLLPGRRLSSELSGVRNHDDRASLVCAMTALCVSVSEYAAVGDDDGWIILPPRAFVRDWAWQLLQENIERPTELIVEQQAKPIGECFVT